MNSINPIAFAITFAFGINIVFAMAIGEFTFKEAILVSVKYFSIIGIIIALSIGAGWLFAC